MTFDESYNMREAVDFLNDKLGVREKLIQSAKQFSEKSGNQKFNVTVKRFEDLIADFLRLYQPIFDKISGHREALQKEVESQKDALTGVLGMIQVAKGVEVLADRVRELETEAKGIESGINEKVKTLEKIEDLLRRTRHQMPEITRQSRDESVADISDESDDFMLGLREPSPKSGASKKSAVR
jgi:methyl-accepting chemotaxis protein